MSLQGNQHPLRAIDALYRAESRRVLATLIRLLGDFDLAEDALQDAFAAAAERWPREGVPANPRAWLVSAGRYRAIDALRRRERLASALPELARASQAVSAEDPLDAVVAAGESGLEDDRLRLIFTCCHPALAMESRIALTLRTVCGLTTEEIARAFLVQSATLGQRLVRARAKIRTARIPYVVPTPEELPERLDGVLHVIYLVFNEGYAASAGTELIRAELTAEAIRLGRLLAELLPEPEVLGLLALMLLHDARRPARTGPSGELILLADQDRRLWNRAQIEEGIALLQRACSQGPVGSYTLQAAIAAAHATAPSADETDWSHIAGLYEVLARLEPSPVVELNAAVAVAMRDGPAAGLARVEHLLARGELSDYHLAHSVRADLLRRLHRTAEAAAAYRRALELARQEPERRFLERRLRELDAPPENSSPELSK